jgi:hypothetical protein
MSPQAATERVEWLAAYLDTDVIEGSEVWLWSPANGLYQAPALPPCGESAYYEPGTCQGIFMTSADRTHAIGLVGRCPGCPTPTSGGGAWGTQAYNRTECQDTHKINIFQFAVPLPAWQYESRELAVVVADMSSWQKRMSLNFDLGDFCSGEQECVVTSP